MLPREILDFVPEDVHKRLASFMRSNSYYDGLNFAKRSEKQRMAMIEALEYKLFLSDVIKDDINDWIAIFGRDTRTLDSSNLKSKMLPENFRNLPNLVSAHIYGNSSQFAAVKRSPRLKSLSVVVNSNMNPTELCDTLASLPLEELSLQCDGLTMALAPVCIYSSMEYDHYLRLGHACPNVTKLVIKCTCADQNKFWPLLYAMGSLRHASLHAKVQKMELASVEMLDRVEIHENIPIRHVLYLGPKVTAIAQIRRASIGTVAKLAEFPFLNSLRLGMIDGAEKALPRVINNVEELDLSWGYDDYYDDLEDCGYGDGDVSFDSEVRTYYAIEGDTLRKILRSAPELRCIHLRRAIIPVEVVVKIIETMGHKLELLSIHMDQQSENPAERLAKILQAASLWCPNVKKIELLTALVGKQATYKMKQICYKGIELLQRTSPFVATTSLRQYIDGIQEVPEQ